jgi:hypothetical protein
MSIQVTLTFANEAELLAYFAKDKAAPAKETAAPKASKPSATGDTTSKPEKSSSPASHTTQPAAASAAEQSEGNVTTAATSTASPTASPASSETSTPAPDFETVKKAFLALSTKEGGRARCEAVLKPFSLNKLSEAKADQYGDILIAINKAGV